MQAMNVEHGKGTLIPGHVLYKKRRGAQRQNQARTNLAQHTH
jgi:hypothetical protein